VIEQVKKKRKGGGHKTAVAPDGRRVEEYELPGKITISLSFASSFLAAANVWEKKLIQRPQRSKMNRMSE
jgi:hypothetical protein